MENPDNNHMPINTNQGEKEMDKAETQAMKPDLNKFENTSLFLWTSQALRKILGRPMLQEEVLDKVVGELKADGSLLGVLLFGSLATGTQTWKSDIDLIFIYQDHEPDFGLENKFVDGIAVQYFFTTLDKLVENQETVPYLLHMFCNGKLLFDRHGTVAPVLERLRQYFAGHPEMEAEWKHIKELHQVEKNGPACQQTTIIQRWDELEDKYSGGVRKRTFFRTLEA